MQELAAFTQPSDFMKLLCHDLRWKILRSLAISDLRVQEMVEYFHQPQNLISYHLQKLRAKGLVSERRSLADAREIYYSLNVERLRSLYFSSGEALHPAIESSQLGEVDDRVDQIPPLRVLFLCTHNSARSQMAEGLLRTRSRGHIEVHSAGNEPSRVHPLAVRAMKDLGIDISKQYSKSLMEFLDQEFDYVITVCDKARESCPIFPGNPQRIHWSIPDPSAVEGDEEVRYQAFRDTALQLSTRIGYLLTIIRQKHRQDQEASPE